MKSLYTFLLTLFLMQSVTGSENPGDDIAVFFATVKNTNSRDLTTLFNNQNPQAKRLIAEEVVSSGDNAASISQVKLGALRVICQQFRNDDNPVKKPNFVGFAGSQSGTSTANAPQNVVAVNAVANAIVKPNLVGFAGSQSGTSTASTPQNVVAVTAVATVNSENPVDDIAVFFATVKNTHLGDLGKLFNSQKSNFKQLIAGELKKSGASYASIGPIKLAFLKEICDQYAFDRSVFLKKPLEEAAADRIKKEYDDGFVAIESDACRAMIDIQSQMMVERHGIEVKAVLGIRRSFKIDYRSLDQILPYLTLDNIRGLCAGFADIRTHLLRDVFGAEVMGLGAEHEQYLTEIGKVVNGRNQADCPGSYFRTKVTPEGIRKLSEVTGFFCGYPLQRIVTMAFRIAADGSGVYLSEFPSEADMQKWDDGGIFTISQSLPKDPKIIISLSRDGNKQAQDYLAEEVARGDMKMLEELSKENETEQSHLRLAGPRTIAPLRLFKLAKEGNTRAQQILVKQLEGERNFNDHIDTGKLQLFVKLGFQGAEELWLNLAAYGRYGVPRNPNLIRELFDSGNEAAIKVVADAICKERRVIERFGAFSGYRDNSAIFSEPFVERLGAFSDYRDDSGIFSELFVERLEAFAEKGSAAAKGILAGYVIKRLGGGEELEKLAKKNNNPIALEYYIYGLAFDDYGIKQDHGKLRELADSRCKIAQKFLMRVLESKIARKQIGQNQKDKEIMELRINMAKAGNTKAQESWAFGVINGQDGFEKLESVGMLAVITECPAMAKLLYPKLTPEHQVLAEYVHKL